MQQPEFIPPRWRVGGADEGVCRAIASGLGISPVAARVLARRGAAGPEEAGLFINPSLEQIPDPSGLPGMNLAVQRLARAVEAGERIAIFGDYDADGIAGAALIADFLEDAGAGFTVSLPRRMEDGYGITPNAVERLARDGARLILTVDNGTTAFAAAERARDLGVEMIVTDHHCAKDALPQVAAVVNPRLAGPETGLRELAGCGVAFMLALALRRALREGGLLAAGAPNLKRSLDLVAIGTIADVVPLTGVNRILAGFGLAEIAAARRPGIRSLMRAASLDPSSLTTQDVAFRIAPRINAAGRVGDPVEALSLLRERSPREAELLAERLCRANRERQSIEERCLEEALEAISKGAAGPSPGAIVVDSIGWHVGVIGIVASRLAERFRLPAVVITRETSPARGSCRSFGGVDMLGALARCSELMAGFGGHAGAAGLTIDPANISELRRRLSEACAERGAAVAPPCLEIDAAASPHEITPALVDELARMAPFGEGNPEPLLSLEGVKIASQRIVGNGHLKLTVTAGASSFDAIGFNMAGCAPAPGASASIAFSPQWNSYNGSTSIQLKLKGIAPHPAPLAPEAVLR